MKIAALRWDRHSDDRIVHRLVPFLSADQQERYARLSQRADRHRMVIAEVFVRCQICRLTGRRNDEIAFIRNRYGKPYLAPDNSIYFNLAYSGSWIVTAIDRCDVGIDIERIGPMNNEAARTLCTPREYRIAIGLAADARARFLHWLWTAKQSYLKARGTGRYGPLDELKYCQTGFTLGASVRMACAGICLYPDRESGCGVLCNGMRCRFQDCAHRALDIGTITGSVSTLLFVNDKELNHFVCHSIYNRTAYGL